MPKRRPRRSDLLGLVGWVFADLLLALTIVFIATQPGNPEAAAQLAASGTTTTTSTSTTVPTTTTTTEPPAPPGVDSEFLCFTVRAEPGLIDGPASAERDLHLLDLAVQTKLGLEGVGGSDRRAGIVLSFGVSDEPGLGTSVANAYNDSVLPLVPEVLSSGEGQVTASRGFWNGNPGADRPQGTIEVNVYPITDELHPPLPRGTGQSC